jgi:sortase (surface protein transpeptidase)
MRIKELIKQLEDMRLLYGDKVILTVINGESEYTIKSISGIPCAKYFKPEDKIAEVIITIDKK